MNNINNDLHEITKCEVCGNQQLSSVLNLGLHPMCDDLVPIGDERICKEYPIEILFCKNCLTAHQRFQVPKQDLFPTSYHYRSRFTKDVLNGMSKLVDSCEQKFGVFEGKKVLDIGCNDGSLLDFFRTKGAITLGIEPTDAYRDVGHKEHITFNDFLSKTVANNIVETHDTMDFISFTNVFAHIEDLNEVIESLKILMNPNTIIIIENHYLGAVLDGNQFDTFYHEHPRTYSYTSFTHIAHSLGVELLEVEFPARYGGNIRVFLGNDIHKNEPSINLNDLAVREQNFTQDFEALRNNMEHWQQTQQAFLKQQVKNYGKLKAKAFPGRAAILIKLLGLDERFISEVYEKSGSLKIGHYVPGTRIPIHSDDELFNLPEQTQPLLNLAWHISREIQDYMLQNGYKGKIVDIFS